MEDVTAGHREIVLEVHRRACLDAWGPVGRGGEAVADGLGENGVEGGEGRRHRCRACRLGVVAEEPRRLVQRGHEVCLLESGGLDFEQATQDLYRGANVGMPYYDLDQSRLRFFGGTVAIWGGRCALLDPIDFERREWVPHSGWPIGRADLDPYYRQANDQLELGEFNYEDDVWGTLGVADPGFDPDRIDAELWRFDETMERFAASRARSMCPSPW